MTPQENDRMQFSSDAEFIPKARIFHSIIYRDEKLFLTGGQELIDGAVVYFNDTWVFDLS
jgi:hypothetical protein